MAIFCLARAQQPFLFLFFFFFSFFFFIFLSEVEDDMDDAMEAAVDDDLGQVDVDVGDVDKASKKDKGETIILKRQLFRQNEAINERELQI